jgi:hypothetical protein
VSRREPVPEDRRSHRVKINARLTEISFPKNRRKSLSISLRKEAKNRENGPVLSELHSPVCDRTTRALSAI